MPLNNSHGFPSILLVNFSILYTVGKTKLSKNGKKNMRFFDILSRSTKKQEAVSLAFLHRIFEQKYMRASVKTACREKTCLAFALSRAQRVSVIVRPKLYHCTISTGIMVTSCVYSFSTDKIFSLFRKVQFSVSHFIYLFIYLFILQCLLFLVSPKVLNTYRNPSPGTDETRFVLAQRMLV